MNVACNATLREVRLGDVPAIVSVDASLGGKAKEAYWTSIVEEYGVGASDRVALVAEVDGAVHGFLFGEVRAWEFGSSRCGWIFSVAVRPECARSGIASQLCDEAVLRFGALGVDTVRTMVRREDVPLQALFRSLGFRAGPFSEMETRVPLHAVKRGGGA